MNSSNADRLIKKIDTMRFRFPHTGVGYGVDPSSGEGQAPEKISDEEGVEVHLQIPGEPGLSVISGTAAMKIYNTVWHFSTTKKRAFPETSSRNAPN